MKDYEHRLLEQRQQNLNGQVYHLEEPSESFLQDQNPNDLELADHVVNACLIELNMLETPQNTPLGTWIREQLTMCPANNEPSLRFIRLAELRLDPQEDIAIL